MNNRPIPLFEGNITQEQPEQEQPEQEQPVPEQMIHAVSKLQEGISMLGCRLTDLEKDFASKLKYDASKQQIIDRQHEELERYRSAQAEKVSRGIINDVIQEIDDVEKTQKFYANADPTPENYAKLLKLCMDYSESLRDLLERHDVYAFRSEAGSQFSAKRQRAMRTVPVADEACARTIQESLRWGFEDESGKVIRPEMVNVYVYLQPDDNHSDN